MNMTFLQHISFSLRYNTYVYKIAKVFIMVDTIEQALQPIFIGSFIFGFGIIKYPFDHPRICLSIFYILIIWSVYVYVFYYIVILFSLRNILNNTLTVFLMIINMLVTIISVITTFHKHKVYVFLLHTL